MSTINVQEALIETQEEMINNLEAKIYSQDETIDRQARLIDNLKTQLQQSNSKIAQLEQKMEAFEKRLNERDQQLVEAQREIGFLSKLVYSRTKFCPSQNFVAHWKHKYRQLTGQISQQNKGDLMSVSQRNSSDNKVRPAFKSRSIQTTPQDLEGCKDDPIIRIAEIELDEKCQSNSDPALLDQEWMNYDHPVQNHETLQHYEEEENNFRITEQVPAHKLMDNSQVSPAKLDLKIK